MRFLLNPASNIASKANSANLKSSLCGVSSSKTWGQQCSPRCGCVVRFECELNESNKIVSSKYNAKTVMTKSDQVNGGKLQPILTHHSKYPRPMLQNCTCNTLHKLASSISKNINHCSLEEVRNMTEFKGIRSSEAFRHAALHNNNLSTTDTHCFDVVEEAFTAMVRGNMLSARRKENIELISDDFKKSKILEYNQQKSEWDEYQDSLSTISSSATTQFKTWEDYIDYLDEDQVEKTA